MTLIADFFPTFRTSKNVIRQLSKRSCLKNRSKSNMVNQCKHSWNLDDSIFIKFIDHCEGICVGKSLF